MAKIIVVLDIEKLELDRVHTCTKCGAALDADQEPNEKFFGTHAQPAWVAELIALSDVVGKMAFVNGKVPPNVAKQIARSTSELVKFYIECSRDAYEADNSSALTVKQ